MFHGKYSTLGKTNNTVLGYVSAMLMTQFTKFLLQIHMALPDFSQMSMHYGRMRLGHCTAFLESAAKCISSTLAWGRGKKRGLRICKIRIILSSLFSVFWCSDARKLSLHLKKERGTKKGNSDSQGMAADRGF